MNEDVRPGLQVEDTNSESISHDASHEQYRGGLEPRILPGYPLRETAAEVMGRIANATVIQQRALRRTASTAEIEGVAP